ncbi:MAG: hypothetical protein PWQ23_269 [Thermoanaerobacter sp.]|jgi:hypothetical protein|nr:hypothetical protein [Thermoanaerobacter sp.]
MLNFALSPKNGKVVKALVKSIKIQGVIINEVMIYEKVNI